MFEWNTAVIGHYVELINGFAFPSTGFTEEEGMPLIRIRDLTRCDTEVNYRGRYPEKYVVKKGDLLIGMDGDFLTIRWKGNDALLNQRVCKLITKDRERLIQDFLFYRITEEIAAIHRITAATTVKHLSSKDILGIEIKLPSRSEQTKIADILSTVDQAIDQTEALIAKQQRIKTGLMQDLLTRGIDKDGNLRSEDTHEFKDSPLGRIPVEWEVKQLSEYADVNGGKRLPAGHEYGEIDTGFRYLRVLDFYEREINFYDLALLEERTFKALERYEIVARELCVSIAGSLGYFSVVVPPQPMRIVLTENAARMKPSEKANPEVLCEVLNSDLVHTQIKIEAGTGGGVPKLALFRIESLLVPLPKARLEQERIIEILQTHREITSSYVNTLMKLRALKTALMQDLLTGEVTVTPLLTETDIRE